MLGAVVAPRKQVLGGDPGITVRFRGERRGIFGPREDFTALDDVSRSVRQMSDDISVLKDGRVVETGPSEAFFGGPSAVCSRDLLAQTPTVRFDAAAA